MPPVRALDELAALEHRVEDRVGLLPLEKVVLPLDEMRKRKASA